MQYKSKKKPQAGLSRAVMWKPVKIGNQTKFILTMKIKKDSN
jgi:hypothetical protein